MTIKQGSKWRAGHGKAGRLKGGGKFTQELAEKFYSYARLGMPMKSCCALTGIHHDTLAQWRLRGKAWADGNGPASDEKYFIFAQEVEKGRHAGFAVHVANLDAAAKVKLQNGGTLTSDAANRTQWILENVYSDILPGKKGQMTKNTTEVHVEGDKGSIVVLPPLKGETDD